MKVLVACERTGRVRDAFRAKGHDAWSCDIEPAIIPSEHHLQCDVRTVLDSGWDMMIGHPPCTYLCAANNAHINKPGRREKQKEAMEFFMELWNAPIPKIALENPPGHTTTAFRKPDQTIEPWMFGHKVKKLTGLWLKNLPKLVPTKIVSKGMYYVGKNGRKYYLFCNISSVANRSQFRSATFEGIAQAMAEQWGGTLEHATTTQGSATTT